MPKAKTHSGAKKRFNVTGGGKIKRSCAYIGHKLTTSKTRKQKQTPRSDIRYAKCRITHSKKTVKPGVVYTITLT